MLLVLLGAGVLLTPGVQADTTTEAELAELRGRIAAVEADIRRQLRRRDAEQARLAEAERLIQSLRRNLAHLREQRESNAERLAALRGQLERQREQLAHDKAVLAEQLRAAYKNGGQEQLRLLLNEEDPALVGRLQVYYRYLSEARLRQVRAITGRLEELAGILADIEQAEAELSTLQAQREKELTELDGARKQRRQLISGINTRLRKQGNEKDTLEREQQRLEELLVELADVLRDFPVGSRESFAALKGKLAWPVRGNLLASFGQPRSGSKVTWNGVLIAAEGGTPVRTVARGRIAYADWLPGLGLLAVIEHSDGYISLYGHNETLVREAGSWVEAGDQIATVGESGGLSSSALYFEIRRGKRPVRPDPWFKGPIRP